MPASSKSCAIGDARLVGEATTAASSLIEQTGVVRRGLPCGIPLGHPVAIGRQRIDDGQQFDVVAVGELLGVEPAEAPAPQRRSLAMS